jgi:hypothetical protein
MGRWELSDAGPAERFAWQVHFPKLPDLGRFRRGEGARAGEPSTCFNLPTQLFLLGSQYYLLCLQERSQISIAPQEQSRIAIFQAQIRLICRRCRLQRVFPTIPWAQSKHSSVMLFHWVLQVFVFQRKRKPTDLGTFVVSHECK